MAWIVVAMEQPPAPGTIMVREGHAGAWEPYYPGVEGFELHGGIVESVKEGAALILVSGEYPREDAGEHLDDAISRGLLKEIAFTEAAIE